MPIRSISALFAVLVAVTASAAERTAMSLSTGRVTAATAVMRARLASPGDVTAYLGPADGGTRPDAWQYKILLGERGTGVVEAPVEGLQPATTYFFSFCSRHGGSETWPVASGRFTTPAALPIAVDPSFVAGGSFAPERGVADVRPAARWQEGLLAGNGTIGALVLGDPVEERIVLSHERLFLPLHEPLPPVDTARLLPRIRELIAGGQYQAAADTVVAESLAEGYGPKRWTDPFIPAFDLLVHTSAPVGGVRRYARSVDYTTGLATVRWEDDRGAFRRRLFVSRADGVAVLSIEAPANQPTISCEIELAQRPIDKVNTYWREQEKFARGLGPIDIAARPGWLTYRSGFRGGPGGYQGAARVTVEGGRSAARDRSIVVDHARRILVVVGIEPLESHAGASWLALTRRLAALGGDVERLLERHAAIHRPMFERVKLDLGGANGRRRSSVELLAQAAQPGPISPALLEATFDAGRYETLSASGELPPNLQGKWTGTWGGDWSSDYTLNGNVQVAVASLLEGGLAECMRGLFSYLESLVPASRENARRMYGARGILLASRTTTHGFNNHFDKTWPMTFWTAGAGWFSHFFWDYYLYTGDKDFLVRRALPFMIAAADFYEDFLVEGPDGRLHFNPSYSPENNPGNSESQACVDATMDIAVARQLLRDLVDASGVAGAHADRVPRWKAMLAKLPDYQVNEDGAVKEWAVPALHDNYGHRHNSHLYALFFGPDPQISGDDRLRRAFARAIELRMKEREKQGGGVMAFGAVQLGQAATSLGDGATAYRILRWLVSGHYFVNLATSHDPGPEIFNADLSGGLPDLVMRMLVQSAPGRVDLLPARPQEWPTGSIEGVWCRGQVVVRSLRWHAGAVEAILRSPVAQEVTVATQGQEIGVSLPADGDVTVSFKVKR